jgi:tetratricopeptide (TPR) repeat protein
MIAFRCNRSTYGVIAGVLLQLGASCLSAAEQPSPLLAPGSPLAIKQEYQAQFEKRDWTAAAAAAQKLVDAARPREKTDPLGLAEALILLGNAEAGSKNAIAAELHFSEALTLTEGRVGPTSSRLIEPLTGLGYALAAQGRHEPAVPLMERALVVWRRNYGLFDTKQASLLRNLAESEGTLRRLANGERHMQYLLSIGERNFGREDPRVVPLLCIVGNWYVQNALTQRGRDTFRKALEIVDSKLGRNNLAAVDPLRGLAFSYVSDLLLANYGPRPDERDLDRQGTTGLGATNDSRPNNPRYLSPESERALGRAIKILDSNADRSAQTLVDVLIQAGDIAQLRSMFDQALPYYRRAAMVLTTELKSQAGEASPLSFPAQIYYPVPLQATRNLNRAPEEVVERYVQTAFTVSAQGTVKDVRVTDKDASARQVAEALDSIKASRYRPRFVDGEPVDTNDFIYRQVFKQRKEAE